MTIESNSPLSPDNVAERMREIRKMSIKDEEGAHVKADELMCEVLRELGYGEAVDVFKNMRKRYA